MKYGSLILILTGWTINPAAPICVLPVAAQEKKIDAEPATVAAAAKAIDLRKLKLPETAENLSDLRLA
ncbi:MAG: hypothetical protein KDA85_13140, partial [Planctomycetaceae bacterium]|nr:hypothetical protein [Planctomycetaceae bacterium]